MFRFVGIKPLNFLTHAIALILYSLYEKLRVLYFLNCLMNGYLPIIIVRMGLRLYRQISIFHEHQTYVRIYIYIIQMVYLASFA